jgi:hypothetical protein
MDEGALRHGVWAHLPSQSDLDDQEAIPWTLPKVLWNQAVLRHHVCKPHGLIQILRR